MYERTELSIYLELPDVGVLTEDVPQRPPPDDLRPQLGREASVSRACLVGEEMPEHV